MASRLGRSPSKRILFLTCHLPYPPHSGGRRREFELLRRIGAELEIELYAACKSREDWDHVAALAEHCIDVRLFATDPVTDAGALAGMDRYRMHRSRGCTAAVHERLRSEPLLAHVEGSYLMQHLPQGSVSNTVLVEQNVESSLWRQRAAGASGREFARCQQWFRRNSRLETGWWTRTGLCAAVSESDAEEISRRSGREVLVIPDGCDHLPPARSRNGTASNGRLADVVMVSNFAYEPNVDAARFFVGDVLPRIRRRVPQAACVLVGNGPPPELRRLCDAEGVTLTGRVESVEPYRERAGVIVSPHRVGGGVKVQVLEALRQGKALIATGVALQGLPPQARTKLRAVEGADAFAEAVVRALIEPLERQGLEARARLAATALPSWDDAAEALLGAYERVAAARELVA